MAVLWAIDTLELSISVTVISYRPRLA